MVKKEKIDWSDIKGVSADDIVMLMIKSLSGFRDDYYSTIEKNDLNIKKINDDYNQKKNLMLKSEKDKIAEIDSKKITCQFEVQHKRDNAIAVLKEKKKQEEINIASKIKDVNSQISYAKKECDIKINNLLNLRHKANEIKSSLELGRNSRLFFEIENNSVVSDFSFIEKGKAIDLDYAAVSSMVDLFNSETGFFKKKIAMEHGTQLWAFLNWVYSQINIDVEEVESYRDNTCAQLESQKSTISQKFAECNDYYETELKKIKDTFKHDMDSIEKRIDDERKDTLSIFEDAKVSLEKEYIESLKLANETAEKAVEDTIFTFQKTFESEFPVMKIKEFFEYHMINNMINFDNYACANTMPDCYEIGMSDVKIGEYIVCEKERSFLKEKYNLIIYEEAIRVPIAISLFDKKNIICLYDEEDSVVSDIQHIATSILLKSPAGSINFVCMDPLKSSNTFAPFNKFVDYDKVTNKLLTGGIATTSTTITEKLSVVSDHIEHVIASCLQSSEITIQEYNKRAGSSAEPYQVLLVMDLPASFSYENIKQLEKIMESGPRCGVYTILFLSKPQLEIAHESVNGIVNNILKKSFVFSKERDVVLYNHLPDMKFTIWNMVPDETLNKVVPIFKKGVEDAGRITVKFSDIVDINNRFYGDSTDGLEVSIGKIGVGNPQKFSIGGDGITHHALIVGNTGSGKTTLLHALINSMMLKYSYEELSIYLLDFKHGVEFKCYGDNNLPNIKLVAIESDRKYGYDVIQRIYSEMKRRSELFKAYNYKDIVSYRKNTGEIMPRILLIIDEYQVLFDSKILDYISSESSELLQRILEQGRGFGIHVILSTQNIEAATNLDSAAYNQIAIRIALMCTSNVAQLALGESADEVNQLVERGMAVYNYNAGAKQSNTISRIAYMSNEERSDLLMSISLDYKKKGIIANTEVVDSHIENKKEENDNLYFSHCKRILPTRSEGMRKKIVLPFGTDEENNLVYCDFENNNFASYIMGAAGSGKSVLLDDIILSIMMNYHPDEVELWLVDFMKTGFSKYAKKRPPHIKNVILGKSDEMIFGIIDRLYELLEERKNIFSSRDWNKMSDVPVDVYMPVIFVIIDEFAEMSQVIAETRSNDLDNDYVLKLENLLREGRKLGFKFVFASQSFSNGMNGLSEAAKDQIQMRMALKNSVSEINDTLDLTPIQRNDKVDNYVATLPPYKTLIKTYLADNNDNYIVQINRVNNLKIENKEIDEYMDELNATFNATERFNSLPCSYVEKNPFIFTGNIPKTFHSQVPLYEQYESEELLNNDEYDEDDLVLYPGTPQGFNGIKTIFLHRDACENILMAGGDVAAVANTILAIKDECVRNGSKVTLWTDSRNILFRKFLKNKFREDDIVKGIEEICVDLNRINDKNDKDYDRNELIIFLGVRNLYDEFDLHEDDLINDNNIDMSEELNDEIAQEFDSLLAAWNQVIVNADKRDEINDTLLINNSNEKTTNVLEKRDAIQVYDARGEINKLLKISSKRGKHFLVYFGNSSDFSSVRPDMRLYKHKILFSMNEEFQYEFSERTLNRMDSTELLYVGNTARYKANVFISEEIPIGGFRVDKDGGVVS